MLSGFGMRFAKASVAPFTPLSLSPAIWLDGADASTMFDATTGGSLVSVNGSIARWEDKSGHARHATQATGVSRPVRKSSILNGKDSVLFTVQYMSLAGPFTSSTYSLFAVVNRVSGAGYQSVLVDSGGSVGYWIYPNKTTLYYGGNYQGTATQTDNTFYLIEAVANTNVSLFLNSAADGTGLPDPVISAERIGGHGSEFLNGYISELLLFPTALGSTDRQAVETYLNTKWTIY